VQGPTTPPAHAPPRPIQSDTSPWTAQGPSTPPPSVQSNPHFPIHPQAQASHTNASQNREFVSVGSITTAQAHDPIQTNNPFSLDIDSSRKFQQLSVPNEETFRRGILASIRMAAGLATKQHRQQTSGESGETLITKMLMSQESIASPTYLRCHRVRAIDPVSTKALGEGQIGVRALVTSNRLLLVDANQNSVHRMSNVKMRSSFLSPPRPGESFRLTSSISDDVWFKPIPLRSITGMELLSSHRSDASKIVTNNRHPGWFVLLIVGFFCLLLAGIQVDFAYVWAVVAMLVFLSCILVYSNIARPKSFKTTSMVYKERKISIGYYDTVANRPLILELELEDNQNLSLAYEWCRVLQQHSPQLSSDANPLILK